jgi:hypothetical protein
MCMVIFILWLTLPQGKDSSTLCVETWVGLSIVLNQVVNRKISLSY